MTRALAITITLSFCFFTAYAKGDSIKFNPKLRFNDFKVKSYTGRSVSPNLGSNKYAHRFRTRIKEGYKAGPNFAGHYTFVSWGCGSPCKMAVIVDRATGTIYDAPAATTGYQYHAGSRMLIVNPPSPNSLYLAGCPWCIPEVYVWDEQKRTFIKQASN